MDQCCPLSCVNITILRGGGMGHALHVDLLLTSTHSGVALRMYMGLTISRISQSQDNDCTCSTCNNLPTSTVFCPQSPCPCCRPYTLVMSSLTRARSPTRNCGTSTWRRRRKLRAQMSTYSVSAPSGKCSENGNPTNITVCTVLILIQ